MRKPYVLRSEKLACPHGFSTRIGGVSAGVFESLNLGRIDTLGDDPALVAENWRLFGEAVGIDTSRFVHGNQVHGNTVRIAAREDAHGICDPSPIEADGYVTDIPGLPLAVFTADCVPLLMHAPRAGVVAAVHCGWKPTAADIMGKAVEAMVSLGAAPSELHAAVGPCIRRCCFQTGPEVPAALDAMLASGAEGLYEPDPTEPGKFRTDLPGAVVRRLTELGVLPENIDDIRECTMCAPETYWSHRSMGMRRGSQASVIMLE